MKKLAKQLIFSILVLTLITGSALATSLSDFADAPKVDHWSYESLNYAVEKELLNGIDGKLQGQEKLTRAQMAAIVNRIFSPSEKASITSFDDVKAEDWYAEDLAKAVAMGALQGRSENQMAPNEDVARQEIFVVIGRLIYAAEDQFEALDQFKDGKDVANWAKPQVSALIEKDMVRGSGEKILPKDSITRAEFSALMYQSFPNIIRSAEDLKDLASGNVLVNTPVDLEDITIDGDLILADGIGKNIVKLKNIHVKGDLILRCVEPEMTDCHIEGEVRKELTVDHGDWLIGEANVDQRQYPLVDPFIHPPFYNARVKVMLNEDKTIKKVEDNDTATKGWDPLQSQEFWDKKNKDYWNVALESGLFEKLEGMTREEVASLNMEHGETDAVTGATESGKAIREAVLNALDGKKGKQFLTPEQTLTVKDVKQVDDSYVISFENTLPEDFEVVLDSVYFGIYNGERKVQNATLNTETMELTIKDDLLPGHYYVNILDASETWRSPDFESGHGTPRHYPHFVIDNDAELSYKDEKIQISKGLLKDLFDNIEEIELLEIDEKGHAVQVEDRNGDLVDHEIEVEPIGHHGIKGGYDAGPFFLEDGTINLEAKTGKASNPVAVFEPGKRYEVEVHVWGFEEPLVFTYEVTGEIKDEKDDAKARASVSGYHYDIALELILNDKKEIVEIKDLTKPTEASKPFYENFVKANGFDAYIGKDKAAVESYTDIVTGATETSKAVKEAVLNGLP